MVAYVLLPPASTSSSLQYSLSLTEDDINSSFAVRWVLGVALGALMRNSVLIQALSAAAGGGQGKETSALRQLETANDYRLTSTKLEAKGGGLFGGAALVHLVLFCHDTADTDLAGLAFFEQSDVVLTTQLKMGLVLEVMVATELTLG